MKPSYGESLHYLHKCGRRYFNPYNVHAGIDGEMGHPKFTIQSDDTVCGHLKGTGITK